MVAPWLEALDAMRRRSHHRAPGQWDPEGIKVRVTAKAATGTKPSPSWRRTAEEAALRLLGDGGSRDRTTTPWSGPWAACSPNAGHLTLGLAESLTEACVASRLVNVPGSSAWFRGSIVAYASQVKFDVLGVPEGPVVSEDAARAMAEGAARPGADAVRHRRRPSGTRGDDQPVGTAIRN